MFNDNFFLKYSISSFTEALTFISKHSSLILLYKSVDLKLKINLLNKKKRTNNVHQTKANL